MNTVTKHLKEYEAKIAAQDALILSEINESVKAAYDLGFRNGLEAACNDLEAAAATRNRLINMRTGLSTYDRDLPEI